MSAGLEALCSLCELQQLQPQKNHETRSSDARRTLSKAWETMSQKVQQCLLHPLQFCLCIVIVIGTLTFECQQVFMMSYAHLFFKLADRQIDGQILYIGRLAVQVTVKGQEMSHDFFFGRCKSPSHHSNCKFLEIPQISGKFRNTGSYVFSQILVHTPP